jgi:hypothetical protein
MFTTTYSNSTKTTDTKTGVKPAMFTMFSTLFDPFRRQQTGGKTMATTRFERSVAEILFHIPSSETESNHPTSIFQKGF